MENQLGQLKVFQRDQAVKLGEAALDNENLRTVRVQLEVCVCVCDCVCVCV